MSWPTVRRIARSLSSTTGPRLARNCAERASENTERVIGDWRPIDPIFESGGVVSGLLFGGLPRHSSSVNWNRNLSPIRSFLTTPSTASSISRAGQVRAYANGFRSHGRRSDIGARARQNQARRLWTIAISGTFVAGFIIVVLNAFQENMMFYITPSQALEKYYIDPSKNKFRLGGLVLEGSVHHSNVATEMEFIVTDLANEILVRYRGALPDLFREGHSVVAEGFLRPIGSYPGRVESLNDHTEELAERAKQAGCYFTAVEVLAKHDEKYMPKEVALAIEKNKKAQDAQQLAASDAANQALVPLDEPSQSSAGKRKTISQIPAVAQKYEISR